MKKNENLLNLMYIPAIIMFCTFIVYPFLKGIKISFTDWNGYSQNYNYIGFDNFKLLVTDKNVRIAFINTLIYGFGSTAIQQILGLLYALLLNNKFKGRNLGRTIIYMPVLISAVIMGYMCYFIFRYDNGALNDLLKLIGMEPRLWLSQPKTAIVILVLINSIQFVGISMIIYLAGLQGIPTMYYEASEIDGATAFQQFKKITLPLLYPAIVTSVTLNLIGGLKLFDIIKALTNGGPGYATHSLSTLVHSEVFLTQVAGYASTIGILLFVSILIVTLITQLYFKKKEVEY